MHLDSFFLRTDGAVLCEERKLYYDGLHCRSLFSCAKSHISVNHFTEF